MSRYLILNESKKVEIDLGPKKVISTGRYGVIYLPKELSRKLVGKYVGVKLIVDADVLEDV